MPLSDEGVETAGVEIHGPQGAMGHSAFVLKAFSQPYPNGLRWSCAS